MKKKVQNNLIISSIITLMILGLVLTSINALNKNETKVFTANKINQKTSEVPQNREVVNIPDKVLKDYLLEGLKTRTPGVRLINNEYIKSSKETEIYKDEIEKITEVYVVGYRIYDLTGIEAMTNLKVLGLHTRDRSYKNDKVYNLKSLEKLKKIKTINFWGYDIEDISSLSKIENLENIDFNDAGIDINQLNELKKLKNKIKKFDIVCLIIPDKNKFKIPVLKNEKNEVIDITRKLSDWDYKGYKLKKNDDGTYSFINKEENYLDRYTYNTIKRIGDIDLKDFNLHSIHIYPPKSNYKETETITKTVKDKSENILNTENEKKLKAVLKRNGKIIDVKPITNIGHRKNAKQLIEFKFNNLRVYEDAKENEVLKEYNYEVEIIGEGLSEGYKLEKNNKLDGNDGDYIVTYVSPKIDSVFKLVYRGIGGDEEKPKVNIRLTRNGVAFGDVVTVNGEYEYIFKGIDKTDEKEKPYKYGVEVVGEVTGYDVAISADGNTVILTKKIEKGKILPYAGPKTNILFGIALVVIIGYSVKVFNNQKRINNIKKIKGIKR